ncbi:MAG TPA: M28 family peptidase, partial [Arenibaculum sp.]|nr:M28 family peptidase [Arenibaculum sp.]
MIGFIVYPYAPEILRRLRDKGYRLGIISNTGDDRGDAVDAMLQGAGLLDLFEPRLCVYSRDVDQRKDSPEIFRLAAGRAGLQPGDCLFVGEDSLERRQATDAGMRVCPHPLLVEAVLRRERLHYTQITVPPGMETTEWRDRVRSLEVVPLSATGDAVAEFHGIAASGAIRELANLQFGVQLLGEPDAPLLSDLYLLRDDRAHRTGFLAPEGQAGWFSGPSEASWLLSAGAEGLLVALPAGRSVEEYHFEEAYHGHNLKLMPDPNLLTPFGTGTRAASWLTLPEPELDSRARAILDTITPERLRRRLERYIGEVPLGDDGDRLVGSRHIHHADNERAAMALALDLHEIGQGAFRVELHQFTHEGRRLFNVAAEMADAETDELVLVTAHLDSTAAFSRPYDPREDLAPGADDDASGTTAVLVIAEALRTLAAERRPRRRIRFVLFNAEEHGLVGSKAYARSQAAVAAPIVAVYQMDMIGYNRLPPRSWEVHAGYSRSTDVQERSRLLADRLGRI